ncbi:MAG: CDP-alcohol phosphatidyltransferase family protein [Brevinematales bacterium]|nr:CDP-alcohol phosphatidyltransferase family protein [Brevinematales bacterium]
MQEQYRVKIFIVNAFTLSRILILPIIFWLIVSGGVVNFFISLILFILSALTDAFDGILARKYNVETKFGFILDPIADKILVLGTLLAILTIDYLMIPLYFFFIILVRDFIVSLLKPISDKKGFPIPTTFFAKVKTSTQYVLVVFVQIYLVIVNLVIDKPTKELLFSNLGIFSLFPYYSTLILVLITVVSGIEYLVLFIKGIFGRKV